MTVPRPRLLCLLQLPPPVYGSAMVNAQVANSELIASRFDLDVIELRFAESNADLGRPTAKKLVRAAGSAARLIHHLWRDKPDAVYCTPSLHGNAFFRDCVYVAIMKAFGVPRVYHLHTKGLPPEASRWRRALSVWAFRGAHVIHLSPHLRSSTQELVDESRAHYVGNGIADIAPAPVQRRSGPIRILYLSHMTEDKGPLVLVDALEELAKAGIEFEATFVGAPRSETCVLAFHDRVAAAGLGARVRYVGGVYGEAKESLLRDHDVLALPTADDAFPLVLLEAMRAGLPVIATAEGAIPEIVENGVTGAVVERSARAIADALAAVIHDSELRQRMGERSRARFLARFTQAHFESRLAEVLADCCARAA